MRAILLLLVSITISGCATPYQKVGANGVHRTGYSEMKVADNKYRVSYIEITPDKAYKGFMRRAAEIAKEQGQETFTVRDITTGKDANGPGTLDQYAGVVILGDKLAKDSYQVALILESTKW